MSRWEEKPLEKVTLFIKDGSHGTHKDYENGIPLLSAKDIEKGKVLIPEDCRKISEKDFDQIHTNYQILENDIALTIVGTIGRVAIVENKIQKFTFQRSVGIFRVDTAHIYPKYCFHYFTSNRFQEALERSKNASAQGGVYLGELAKIKISYPSIPEQRQIATILSTADAVIEKTQAAIAKYKAIKQGMLQDLFTRGINTTTGKLRPSYQDAPELYKESKLGWIPKEWIQIPRLGDHVNILSGFPFNSRLFNSDGEGLPLIRIRDLLKSKIETFFNGEYPLEYLINEGDILVGMDGDFHIVKWNNKKAALLNQRIMKLAQKHNSLIDINYFYYFLFPFLNTVWEKTTATTVKHLSTYDVSEASLFFPIINEQKQIAKKLDSINKKLQTEQDFLHKQQQIKAGLMNDLLSGRKKVSIKEKEIA